MIFLPDTHVSFKETSDSVLYRESFVIFQDVIKNIKNISNLDFIVFGGDLINNDDSAFGDLSIFLDSIEDLNINSYTIIGDREADSKNSCTKQDFCPEFRRNGFENPELSYWMQEPVKNVVLIGLDTSIENKQEGRLSSEQMQWLNEILSSNPDKFTIISMHHPAFSSSAADKTIWKKYILENSQEFLSLIKKYPQVKLILSGHRHNYSVQNIDGKLFVALPSVAVYPNCYKILKIYPDKIEIENNDISFKQIIKKSKNIIIKTDYAREFNPKKPKKILEFQTGGKISKKKSFYFSGA